MPICKRHSICTLVCCVLLFVAITGCRTGEKEFRDAVEEYHQAMADGSIEQAAMIVDDPERSRFFADMEQWIKDKQISNFFIKRVVFNAEKTQATVTVVRDYFDNNVMLVRQKTLVQLWEKRRRTWVMIRGDF